MSVSTYEASAGFLLDTNVISERARSNPNSNVITWFDEVAPDDLYLSVISIAELHHGVELLPKSKRRQKIEAWIEGELKDYFGHNLLPIDDKIATLWGSLVAFASRSGFGISAMDAFLAATAKAHNLILVTRNIRDFSKLGIALYNPWEK